ncbi:hypothetical protein SAMN04487981_101610 [Streptomyces sp. cf386]|uniref:hypothetical protein n=1 Tax=Streptomyces sp. cf386 TaxID=1761904 RepID=UPI0008815A12|nr:hypothetical protein [Streptomyces sp. cf386]SDM46570.1 hypothetical protein SAMN04487981_101610 [Streptomyces sp. cf386]
MQVPFKHPLATHAAGTVLGQRRNGSPIYAIAGGSGEGEGGSGTGTPPPAPGGGGTPPATPPAAPPAATPPAGGDGTDWKAEARKWEDRAKANKTAADELEALKAANMSEQEKAVKAAKADGRTAALAEAAPQIAQARLEAAAARAGVDLGEFAEFIDLTKFVGDGGQVDDKAIQAAVTKFSKLAPKGAGRSGGDMGGGGGSGDQGGSIDKQIEDATKARNFAEVVRLRRLKAAQTT